MDEEKEKKTMSHPQKREAREAAEDEGEAGARSKESDAGLDPSTLGSDLN